MRGTKKYKIVKCFRHFGAIIILLWLISIVRFPYSFDKLQVLSNKNFESVSNSMLTLVDCKSTELESKNESLQQSQKMMESVYIKLSKIEVMIQSVKDDENKVEMIRDKISEMKDNLDRAEGFNNALTDKRIRQKTLVMTLKEQQDRIDRLNVTLNDISYSQKEFMKVQEAQGYLKDIVEATSSNKGIPLVYVKLFLNQCKDTVNDLISDVFGDSIEILDFDINETDFKIPYAINGSPVKDISSASQGQRSIISLALSFALVRQSLSDYNIMLLDEMDGPLYKDDRDKFISILFKQIQAINAEQIFIVSHNNTFDGHNVNIIMTTDENVDRSHQITIMKV